MSERAKGKGRSVIYSMAGVYLFYLAYEIVKNRAESAGIQQVLLLLGAAAFVLIGAGLVGFGFYNTYKIRQQEREALNEQAAQQEE